MTTVQILLARVWLFLPLAFSYSIVSLSFWKEYPEFRLFSMPLFVVLFLVLGFVFAASLKKEGAKLPDGVQVAKLFGIVSLTLAVAFVFGIQRVLCTYLALWAAMYPLSLYRKPLKVVES